jgi:phosphatidate cytidylyltransferase
MLAKRLLVAFIITPVGLALVYLGGPIFSGFVSLILALAAWEYVTLFRTGGLHPSAPLITGGVLILALGRAFLGFGGADWMLSGLVLASMTVHLISFERGCQQAGTDFGVTLGGIFYLGWIGAYLISLRMLPDGMWWMLAALLPVVFADSGAYFAGKRFGRRPFSPRLSPKKTWEGYLGGVAAGTLAGVLLGVIIPALAGPSTGITPLHGLVLGLTQTVLTPLGDLGESMFKRQVGAKDSGNLLPGHGGMFDRIDSWLWAGVIGYYVVTVLFRLI